MSQSPSLAPPSAMGLLTPADVWRIVRKRLALILASVVVLGLGGTAALVAWYVYAPLYSAEGAIEVEPGQGQLPAFAGFRTEVPYPLFEQYIQTEARAVRSDRVLAAALQALGAEQTLYTGTNPTYELGRDLDIAYIPNTQIIAVRLMGARKEQIQAIVREVLNQYIAQLDADRKQVDNERQADLRRERDDLQRQLEELSRKLATYRDEAKVIVADERGGEQIARLTALTRELVVSQVALADASSAWNQFLDLRQQAEQENNQAKLLAAMPEVLAALRQDRRLAEAQDTVSRAAQELASLKQRLGAKHEVVKRMETAYQGAGNDLEGRQQQVLGELFQQQAAVLKNRYDKARAAEADLQARVAEARAAAVDSAKMTAEYRAREEDMRRVRQLLDTVTDGLQRMRIASALSRPNIKIRSVPTIPVEPAEPRLVLYIPAVILFSLLVGLGLSLVLEVIDTRVRTPADVVRQVGIPLLGSIPDLSEDDHLSLDTNLATVSQTVPQSLLAEAFRQFRTSLLFASDQPIRSVLVTSPNPADGKTTVAANLAIAMARTGQRVLLIEANFRRPALGRAFDVPDSVGLSNALVGLNPVAEVIQATSVENLDLIVCGPQPPNPAELLGSAAMRQLIREQSQAYDYVVIDGAPMLLVADNYLLAEAVDGTVLVYGAGENTRGLAQRAARQVISLKARLLGAVLNRVRATKGGYFREAYQAYYDYAGNVPTATAPSVASAKTRAAADALADAARAAPPAKGDNGLDG